MADILIVYATREGQTEKIARHMSEVLRGRGDAVQLLNADHSDSSVAVDRFDVVVLAAPIHSSGYPASIVDFAKTHARSLDRVTTAFCSVGLGMLSRTSDGRAETRAIVDRFLAETRWRPTRVELVAGALPYSKYSFFIRLIMRHIAKKEGGDVDTSRDYEYTDWAALDRFTSELVADATKRLGASA